MMIIRLYRDEPLQQRHPCRLYPTFRACSLASLLRALLTAAADRKRLLERLPPSPVVVFACFFSSSSSSPFIILYGHLSLFGGQLESADRSESVFSRPSWGVGLFSQAGCGSFKY